MSRRVLFLGLVFLTGCPDDQRADPADAASGADGALVDDLGPGGAGGGGAGGDAGAGGAGGGIGGEGGGGGEPMDGGVVDSGPEADMFIGIEVDSCEAACGRYAACEQVERFGGYEACLGYCARVTRDAVRPDAWWDCVAVEACNLLRLCPAPELEPFSCDEVCARAADCGVELPDCESACDAGGEAFRRCGEAFADACGGEAFVACLGRDIYPSCAHTCAEGVRCNVLREEGCLLDCVAAVSDADPLFNLRAAQRNTCVGRAQGQCEQINRCINPPGPGEVDVVTPQQFCARWSGCGFDDFFPCQELLQELGQDPGVIACAFAQMGAGCPEDPFLIFEICLDGGGGPNPQLELCNRLCEAERVCGVLGDDPLAQPNCVNNCTGGANADPDEVERAAAALACVGEARCPALQACLGQIGPAVECREHCATLAACGGANPDCQAECDAVWARDRHAAYRSCVAEAEGCDGVAACEIAPGAACEAYCVRANGCGLENGAGCEARCDDAHFADPVGQRLFQACVISAPECRAQNRNDPSAFTCRTRPTDGLSCLGFCRATTECAEGGDLGACLQACGQGLVGDDGLRFLSGRDCLQRQPPDAACPALDACVPDDLDVDCPAFCARAAECGAELDDCVAACGEDPLSRLRVLQRAECLAGAGEDCGAVRACLMPAVRPPDPDVIRPVDEATLCAAWDRCGLDDFFGPCEILLDEFGRDPQAQRCVYDLIRNQCPQDPEEIFACLDGGGPQVSPIAAECAALCEARSFCGDRAAADQVACRRACEGEVDADDADAIARLFPRLACAQAWSCADLATCLDHSAPADVCTAHCRRLAACGAVPNEAVCRVTCDRDFARQRQFAFRGCVTQAADCEAVNACELAAGIPCDEACAARAECGDRDPGCVAQCDDAHFLAPLETALEVACILGAEACEGAEGLFACFQDPGPGARACLGYCRAITECDPESDEALVDCLNGCVGGFGDRNGLGFAAAADCLQGVQPDADCRLVRACLPEALAVDCPAYCAELEACRIPAEGCAAACAGGEVSLDRGGCVADARRGGGGCGAVAACVGFEPPLAGEACVRACDLREACDRAVDPFLCRLGCTPPPPALPVQLACADVVQCRGDLDACFDLPADLDPDCVMACQGAAACGEAFAAGCPVWCTGQVASGVPDEGWAAAIGACLGQAIDAGRCDRAAAEACFSVGVPIGLNRGFGHHGSCDTWNDCGNAQTCADAACAFLGHGPALSWEEGLCMDLDARIPGGMDCDLFNRLPGPLDEDWPGFCNIPVAYDLVCRP